VNRASIRTRLIIQNIGVMAVALILLGFLTYYIAAGSQMRALDHDLERRSQRFVDDHRRPPPQGEEGMRPPPPPPNSHQPFRGVLLDLQKQPLTQDSASVYAPNDIQRGLDGEQVYSNIVEGGVPLRVITHPIIQSGRVIGVAQHAAPLDEVFRVQSELANTLIILFPISMGIISIAVNSLVKRSLRPVRNISRTADKMGSQDLALRLPIYGNDEFAELSTTLNGLLARLQNAFQRQEEVLEQQRQFVADASHELRTPLTVIKANADLYQKGERTTESYRSALGVIGRSANTMNRLVQDLLLLAKADSGQLMVQYENLNAQELLKEVTEAFAAREGAQLDVNTIEEELLLRGNFDELKRVLTNLLENAYRHTPPEGRIVLSLKADAKQVQFVVADTGSGVSAEHLPHLTERFYRIDTARARAQGGTGLGLSICKSILDAHQGTIQIESAEGVGTTVTVSLPRISC